MTNRFRLLSMLGALVLAVTAGTLPAAAADAKSGGSEREFLSDAASGGMMEVELGRYAEQHASNDRVKQFGRRMVDDHSKANAQLKQVAAKQSVTLPATMNAEHRETMSRLTKMKGAEFDRAYMAAMVKDHQEDVQKFRSEASSAKDADVKSFAAQTLPTLESHLQMAKEINSSMERTTSGARSRGD
jgi:putative membrane protein